MESSWGRPHQFSLKKISFLTAFGATSLVCLGAVMAATNPTPKAYSNHATHELTRYADSTICAEAPTVFGLNDECRSLLKSNQAEIQDFIISNTDRRNFFFFSVYTTDLSIASFLPTYHVQTVAIFQRFYVVDIDSVDL